MGAFEKKRGFGNKSVERNSQEMDIKTLSSAMNLSRPQEIKKWDGQAEI